MKHKLLFSTAIVAASLGYADLANAGTIISDKITEDVTAPSTELEDTISFGTSNIVLDADATLTGRVTLHNATTFTKGEGNTLTVKGFLTETQSGSDLSAIKVNISDANSMLILGNNLTIGDVNMGDGTYIATYLSDEDNTDHGQYAKNPAKTLTVNGTLETNGNVILGKNGPLAESEEAGYASLTLNGDGKIENNGTLNLWRSTTLGLDVDGTGEIVVANKANNKEGLTLASGKTIKNNITVETDKKFTNNGTVEGEITNNGIVTTTLSGIKTITNNSVLNLINGGTLKNGIITNNATVGMQGDYTLGEAVTLGGSNIIFGTLNLDKYTFNGNLILADGSTLAFNFGENDSKVAGTVSIGQDKVATLKPIFANGFDAESIQSHTYANEVDFDEPVGQAKKGELKIANSLYNVDFERNDDGTVKNYNVLTVLKKNADEIAESTGANANQAAAIEAVTNGANTGNAAFDNVANNINDMLQSGDAAQVQAALDTITAMSPEAAPVANSVASETVGQVFGAISTRMSGGSIASANQGMSSGDSLLEKGAAWVQTLVNRAKLKQTADNGGFKSNTAGIALGFEKQISDDVKAGIGYAYNDGEVKSAQRKSDVDTHTAFAYGEYKPSNWFINGMLSHSWSRYDEKTAVSTAKHDADAIGLQVLTGYDFAFDNTTVTPEIGLRYVHVKQDSYSNSLGANIGGDKSDILTGVFGATVTQNWNLDNGMILKPEARLAFTYDMKNDAANATVLLPNGSSYTVDGKALKRFGVEAGLGLTAEINDHIDLTLGYEGRYRDDYRDHTGLLNAKYKF